MQRRRVEEENLRGGVSPKGWWLVRDRFQIRQEKERIRERKLQQFDEFFEQQFDEFFEQQ